MLTRIFIFASFTLLLIALPKPVTRSAPVGLRQTGDTAFTPTPAPAASPQPCPTIELTGPTGIVMAGEPATFAVSTTSGETYTWTVVNGKIISGDGSPSITVATDGQAGQTITATVEIGGLSANCFNNTATYSITVAAPPFRPTTITGTVKAADGAVLSGASVKAVKIGGSFSAPGTTDADGKYLLRPVETGRYRVTASVRGYRQTTLQTELRDAGDLTELNFVLRKSGGGHGRGRRRG